MAPETHGSRPSAARPCSGGQAARTRAATIGSDVNEQDRDQFAGLPKAVHKVVLRAALVKILDSARRNHQADM